MPEPIQQSGVTVAIGDRVFRTATVAASPADATETVVASLTIPEDIAISKGIYLSGYIAYTVGTNGTSGRVRVRRASVAGATIRDSGALTRTAAQLVESPIQIMDTGGSLPNQVYVVTLTVGAATAVSTVSAVELVAIVC